MPLLVTKELALADDIEFGMDATAQLRGGNQFNSAYLPYSASESVTEALDARYLGTFVDANFAAIGGISTQIFQVADGVSGFDAVNFAQYDLKTDKTATDLKADKANVLELDNADVYTPSFDYNPSTKLYVDTTVSNAFASGVSGSFTTNDGKTVTVTGGLITGIV